MQSTIVSSTCSCDLREKTRALGTTNFCIGSIVLYGKYYEASRHSISCPLYTRSQMQNSIGTRFHVTIRRNLSILVEASLSCTRGAGGFSISPRLNFQLAVRRSPATILFNDFILKKLTTSQSSEDLVKQLVLVERELLKLFRDRLVSPYERLPNGETHLHVRVVSISISKS